MKNSNILSTSEIVHYHCYCRCWIIVRMYICWLLQHSIYTPINNYKSLLKPISQLRLRLRYDDTTTHSTTTGDRNYDMHSIRLLIHGRRRRGAGGSCLPPKFEQKTIFSGKNREKFGHFVNFFGHISCKIRKFC